MMRVTSLVVIYTVLLASCSGKKVPNVSSIKVDLEVQRFEKSFFSIDSNSIGPSMQRLNQQYPGFLRDFVFNILALPPQPDSAMVVEGNVRKFIQSYRPLKDSADIIFNDFQPIAADVEQGLKFVHYYFPDYKLPKKLITFIGPIDSYGNIVTPDALAVGLQMYMGRQYSLYSLESVQQMYPSYISRRFEKQYIPVNCIKSVIEDMYPDNTAGRPLVEQMVEAGKKLYLLDQLMPNADDTLKTGYTKAQLDGAYANESTIWSFFVQNDLLFSIDRSVIRDYMNDAPKTQALGEASPGFIGQFVGWQIVKKWMSKKSKTKLDELMHTNPKIIYEQAKYKP